MNDLFISLLTAGSLGGIINYLVYFRKLPMPVGNVPAQEAADLTTATLLQKVWAFMKSHWELFGYLLVGIAGAFMFPLVHELINLTGLPAGIKQCGSKHCLNSWQEKVVFGYGLLFGVFTVRLLYGIFGGVLSSIEKLSQEIKELEQKPAVFISQSPAAVNTVSEIENPPATQEMVTDFRDLKNVPDWNLYVRGIDVSHHNADINWAELKKAGIDFAYIKITDGVGAQDKKAPEHARNATESGLQIGYYHFARPDKKIGGSIALDAAAEANEVMARIAALPKASLPLMLDLENDSSGWDTPLAPQQYLEWVLTFVHTLSGLNAKKPIIYSRKEYLDRKLPLIHSLGSYPLWISRYNEDYNKALPAHGWTEWVVWQFSENGKVGRTAPLDLNLFKKHYYQRCLS